MRRQWPPRGRRPATRRRLPPRPDSRNRRRRSRCWRTRWPAMANRFRARANSARLSGVLRRRGSPDHAQRLSGRSLLISNAVVAFAVVGFASLAVAVAITVRPTAAAEPVVGHQNAAPGKFMPLLPTQQQAPVPAPPADQPNAGYQGGIIPDNNGYIPPQLISPSEGPALVPGSPGTPGLVPNPNGPIPIPIIVPYPGWRPGYPPYRPPWVNERPTPRRRPSPRRASRRRTRRVRR